MKKNFLTGLVILLPLVLTLAILGFLVNWLTAPFLDLVQTRLHLPQGRLALVLSQVLILFTLFLFTLLLGLLTRTLLIRSLFRLTDKVLHKIPFVSAVYRTTQEIIKTVFQSSSTPFKQVVLVPFPYPGVYALGLVAKPAPTSCSEAVNQELITVLIPTTPNPTTGFLLMFPKHELSYLDMKSEDAIKYIVSCGTLTPGEAP